MNTQLPTNLQNDDAAWLVQHLDATRKNFQANIRQLLLAIIETRDLFQRIELAMHDMPVSENWNTCSLAMQQKIQGVLESFGVEEISTGGAADPRIHHIVKVTVGEGEPGTITEVLLPGFLWNGELLRPAEVVAVGPFETGIVTNPTPEQEG